MSLEIKQLLDDTFGLDFQVSLEDDTYSIGVKSNDKMYNIESLPISDVTTPDDVPKYISDSFKDILRNALNLRSTRVFANVIVSNSLRNGMRNKFISLDRELIFGTSHKSKWQNNLLGNESSMLTRLFNIDHRCSPDGNYNVVIYKQKIRGYSIDNISVLFEKRKSQVIIEDRFHSVFPPVYAGLFNKNAEHEKVSLSIEEGERFGVYVNGATGRIYVRKGMNEQGNLFDVLLDHVSDEEALIYSIYLSVSSNDVRTVFSRHEIRVDKTSNLVQHDIVEWEDDNMFDWVKAVSCELDCDHNPYTSKSPYSHLLKDCEPKYATDLVWVSPRDRVYLNFDGVWTALPGRVGNSLVQRRYMKPQHYEELQRYALALQLEGATVVHSV